MGTVVLPARDFLAHYQSHPSVDFLGFFYPKKSYPHPQSKRKSGHGHGHGFVPQKSKVKGENPEKKRPWKPKPQEESFPEVGKRAGNRIQKVGDRKFGHVDDQTLKKEPAKLKKIGFAKIPLSMGQVTILKRGQALKPSNSNSTGQLEIADTTTGPLFVSPTQYMHQDPRLLSQDRTMKSRSVFSMESEAATPPGFETEIAEGGNGMKTPNFPIFISEKWAGPAFANSPSRSSLPLPSFSIKKSGQESAEIDRFATRDLRRLLGLD